MTNSPAWHDLSATARAIYTEMAKRYAGDGSNNGRIPYSIREAIAEFHIGAVTACREFKSLQDHGFIEPMMKGAFSLKKRHATEWRLTEFPCDVTNTVSTKDFMRWEPAPKIQNTVPKQKLTASIQKPNGFHIETDATEKQRNGSHIETVKANSDISRLPYRSTTSIPGTYVALGDALPSWDIDISPVPSPGTQVSDYDLALNGLWSGGKQ